MSWIGDLFAGGASGLISGIGDVADKFITTGDEKNQFKLEMEQVITARMNMMNEQAVTEMNAKSEIIQAELKQGDNFTKRMRPSLGYFGMIVIFYNYCIIPSIGVFKPDLGIVAFEMPGEFWLAWGGMMATYSIGRSQEKKGQGNKVTGMLSGVTPSITKLLG